jgi:hypothetical protein
MKGTRVISTDLPVSTIRARSTSTMSIPVPVAELPALVQDAVQSSRRFKLKAIGPNSAELTVGFTWRAWGGRLRLQFLGVPDGSSHIDAIWEPVLGTTLVDYGQGAKDIRSLYEAVLQKTAR